MRGLGEESLPKQTERSTLESFARTGMTPGTWEIVEGSAGPVLQYDSSDRLNAENFGAAGMLTADNVDAAWSAGSRIQLRTGERPYWEQGGFTTLDILGSGPPPDVVQPWNDAKVMVPGSQGGDVGKVTRQELPSWLPKGWPDLSLLEKYGFLALLLGGGFVAFYVLNNIGRDR